MAEVENINRVNHSSDEEDEIACTICLSSQFLGNIKVALDCCCHEYCGSCFERWSREHNRCPLDRMIFTKIDFIQVPGGEILDSQVISTRSLRLQLQIQLPLNNRNHHRNISNNRNNNINEEVQVRETNYDIFCRVWQIVIEGLLLIQLCIILYSFYICFYK